MDTQPTRPPAVIEIRRYRRTRHWAVHVDGELLAVVLYRKGAEAIAARLAALAATAR
jgi:hypothetical protein